MSDRANRVRKVLAVIVCALVGVSANVSAAHRYPSKPIRLIVPFAPAGTSPGVVKRVYAAAVRALQDPAINARLLKTGASIDGNSPEQYAAQIKRELNLRTKIAKDQNIRLTE